jgi:hypothetical protein
MPRGPRLPTLSCVQRFNNKQEIGMRSMFLMTTRLALAALATLGTSAIASDDNRIEAKLRGFQEVPTISTVAQGRFRATVDSVSNTLQYELSYEGLEGDVRMAHIHLGARGTNGGIMVWLCQTTTNLDPSGAAPMCPQSGTVTGLIQASAVTGPLGQGVEANAFGEFLAAIRAGVAYVNIHSSKWPGGEIRGQVKDHD